MSVPTCVEDRSPAAADGATSGRPVRVCFMIDRLFPAGIELQLLLLMKHLDRSRVAPSLCLLDGMDAQTRSLEPKGCPLIRLGVRRLSHLSSVLAAWRLSRFLRREKIDVIHPLHTDSFYFAVPVARLARVPSVVGFRVDLNFWLTPRDRWIGRLVNKWVDATVANCAACREAVVADWGVPPESVTIIPNGVDLARFAAPPSGDCPDFRRHRAAADENGTVPFADVHRVGILANLRAVKNIELFIRAAGRLAAGHPQVQFEIAGEGDLRGPLQALIDELGLGNRVALRGSVADVPAFLQTLDVAVLCSLSEGSPNAIMEYMAAGLPAVVTDVGGNAELVQDGVTGFVVPSGDCDRLVGALDRLLRDRPLASRLGAAARQRAFAEFGVQAQARRYEEFYQPLVQRKCRK